MLWEHRIAGSSPAIPTFVIRCQIAVIDLPVKQGTEVRPLPPELLNLEGRADHGYMVPGRWQPPRKRSSDEPWGFDSLTFRLVRPWPTGKGSSLPSWRSGFDSRRALWYVIGDRLVVGFLALNQATKVRPLLPELEQHRCGVI